MLSQGRGRITELRDLGSRITLTVLCESRFNKSCIQIKFRICRGFASFPILRTQTYLRLSLGLAENNVVFGKTKWQPEIRLRSQATACPASWFSTFSSPDPPFLSVWFVNEILRRVALGTRMGLVLHCASLLRTIFASLARAHGRVRVQNVRDFP